MREADIEQFWDTHPCGEGLVGGNPDDLLEFFERYDAYRYHHERHILSRLDAIDWRDQRVLEIGLGQGADSEQLIRRGARWSGVDLTQTAVDRVRARLELKALAHQQVVKGSVLDLPFDAGSFDVVFSHGVLHHVPDILVAQREIHRVLVPGGRAVLMLYARRSLNYLLSIGVLRRLGLIGLRATGYDPGGLYSRHLELSREHGLRRYLRMSEFIHRNTDGPDNVYSKVYDLADVRSDFPAFTIETVNREWLHAPPLATARLPGASAVGRLLGWHLWVTLRALD